VVVTDADCPSCVRDGPQNGDNERREKNEREALSSAAAAQAIVQNNKREEAESGREARAPELKLARTLEAHSTDAPGGELPRRLGDVVDGVGDLRKEG
jgi:hypothetical protein